ncbi:SAM-dependent methyltransferase [Actinoplanes sp. DH11]|uniref:SAM-dependent methyltransferase n=1 Tax=Actinoplanes sp. DH11 TaxID=2857011 RepID=UPI001E2BB39D|nr:SAM-dependent methyltransferase [Actinoplanes sp. DH11]
MPEPPIDPNRPSAARIYDAFLGGTHNFAADRAVADRTAELLPMTPRIARANRAFLRRVVRFATARGIRQFLDLGSGIPTQQNVHEIATEARVVHVDVDPAAVLYSRHLLGDDSRVAVVHGDLRQPSLVLAEPAVRKLIDPGEPVGILMVAVLHFLPESPALTAALRDYRELAAPGSVLAISHAAAGESPAELERIADLYNRTGSSLLPRTTEQVERFFDGWRLVEPGVVQGPEWRPDPGDDTTGAAGYLTLAGVAVR